MADHREEDGGRGGRADHAADHPDPRQRLLNRLAIGSGVLCGLRLEAATQGTLRLGPGVALDPLGRELALDEPVTIHLHRITDEAGDEVDAIEAEAGVVTIALAHRRRPAGGDRDEGSVVVLVLRGDRDRARPADDLCGLIAPARQTRTESPERRLARFLEAREGDCFAPEGPAYVVLGRVTLGGEGPMKIDPSRAAGRRLVVSNSILLDLVICLWERLEALTGGHPTPPLHLGMGPTPKATPPHPSRPAVLLATHATPPPRVAPGPAPAPGVGATASTASLRVVGVEFLDEWGRPQGELDRLIRPARFPAARGIGAIQVTFSQPLDPGTCTAIEPAAASILVRSDRGTGPDGHVPGTVSVQGNVARYQVDGGHSAFPAGEYEITLYGDEDPAGRRPAIAARDRSRLDGEARTLPSGDGREGGNFVFRLRIGDD